MSSSEGGSGSCKTDQPKATHKAQASARNPLPAAEPVVVLLDNFDSYTHNLAHLIARVTGTLPLVVPSDAYTSWASLVDSCPPIGAVVISPGPGSAACYSDFHLCAEAYSAGLPVLGVCLGHQGLALAFGGQVRTFTRTAASTPAFTPRPRPHCPYRELPGHASLAFSRPHSRPAPRLAKARHATGSSRTSPTMEVDSSKMCPLLCVSPATTRCTSMSRRCLLPCASLLGQSMMAL